MSIPQTEMPNPALPTPPSPEQAAEKWPLERVIKYAAIALVVTVLLIFIIGLVLALFTDAEQTAPRIRIIRDILIIILAFQGILVGVSLSVFLLQAAKLFNLVRHEVTPTLENTQETVNTAKDTVEFVNSNMVEPVIRFNGFMAGIWVLLSNWFGIRKAIKHTQNKDAAHEKDNA